MDKINVSNFNKHILNKGSFKEYFISPYASEEGHFKAVLITSSNVNKPTWLCHYNKRLALILPTDKRAYESIKNNINYIISLTGVASSFYGLFTLDNELLYTIQND